MQLRDYQRAAVNSAYQFIATQAGDPLIVIPTGGGKTPIIGTIVSDCVTIWNRRVLVLSHVKELLSQAEEKVRSINPRLRPGVYSAGLSRRDTREPVIIAGIQSVYNKAPDLGLFDVVLIDEAHLIPDSGEGMYRSFLADLKTMNPRVRVIGLTATPYRTSSGLIYGPEAIFSDVCYEVGVRELIERGFLSPLRSKRGLKIDLSGVHLKGGEFDRGEMEDVMLAKVGAAVAELIQCTQGRSSTIVFCAGVKHAVDVANLIASSGKTVEIVTGDTEPGERAETLARFKGGEIAYLVNVDVLTTGFDAPNVDCVAIMRATASPGLYYQMVGRGLRLSEGKQDCLILDFGGNVERHGPIDQIEAGDRRSNRREAEPGKAPSKTCPSCEEIVSAACRVCPECSHEFPESGPRHDETSSDASPVSVDFEEWEEEILDVVYSLHEKKGENGEVLSRTLRVDYYHGSGNWDRHSEWVCIEHEGWAGGKARAWWAERTETPFPGSIEEAVKIGKAGGIAAPYAVTVRKISGKKFPEIISHDLSPKVIGFRLPERSAVFDPEWDHPGEFSASGAGSLFPVYEDEVPF